jgi:hypothetical protein
MAAMAEIVESVPERTIKLTNLLVSGSIKLGSADDLKIITSLFVKSGNIRSSVTFDVWQHFGPYIVSRRLYIQSEY